MKTSAKILGLFLAASAVNAGYHLGSCPDQYSIETINYPFSQRDLKVKYIDKTLVKAYNMAKSYVGDQIGMEIDLD